MYLSCVAPRSVSSLVLVTSSLSASSSRVLNTAIWASLAATVSRVSASRRRSSPHVCSVCVNCRRCDSIWRWHCTSSENKQIKNQIQSGNRFGRKIQGLPKNFQVPFHTYSCDISPHRVNGSGMIQNNFYTVVMTILKIWDEETFKTILHQISKLSQPT